MARLAPRQGSVPLAAVQTQWHRSAEGARAWGPRCVDFRLLVFLLLSLFFFVRAWLCETCAYYLSFGFYGLTRRVGVIVVRGSVDSACGFTHKRSRDAMLLASESSVLGENFVFNISASPDKPVHHASLAVGPGRLAAKTLKPFRCSGRMLSLAMNLSSLCQVRRSRTTD